MTEKVALVTGASSAIGSQAAVKLADLGFRVAVTARRPDSDPLVRELLAKLPAESLYLPADLIRESEVSGLIDAVVARFGRLDCAFNNAGGTLGFVGPLADMESAAWHEVVDLNLTAVMLSLKHQLRVMREHGGSIVCTAGALAHDATAGMSAYVAAKHAVLGLAKAAAIEGAGHGIRVNALSPGMTVRNESPETHASRQNGAAQKVPLGRLATAGEIAEAAVWLLSDASSFVTGQALVADGGWLAQI